MVSTCGLGRLLSGGAMGYLGASPFHNAFINVVGAAVGVGAVFVWTRWLGHATACDVAAPHDKAEHHATGRARATAGTPYSETSPPSRDSALAPEPSD